MRKTKGGAVVRLDAYDDEALVSVAEVSKALDMGESTVWLFAKRHSLPRYRTTARGKTTLFRWHDVTDAYQKPILAEPRRETGKAAA
jgi:hypothetical protein